MSVQPQLEPQVQGPTNKPPDNQSSRSPTPPPSTIQDVVDQALERLSMPLNHRYFDYAFFRTSLSLSGFPGPPNTRTSEVKNTWILSKLEEYHEIKVRLEDFSEGLVPKSFFPRLLAVYLKQDFSGWTWHDFDTCHTSLLKALRKYMEAHDLPLPRLAPVGCGHNRKKVTARIAAFLDPNFVPEPDPEPKS